MKNKITFKSQVPNIITSINLLAGCISICLTFQDKVLFASLFIFIAGVLDFLDGVAARLLHAYSDIGKMLDSLADVISFGVAPSVILFRLLNISIHPAISGFELNATDIVEYIVPSMAFLVAIFSAIRLAKFNIDERQTTSFIGLPTPANAFFIASLPLIFNEHAYLQGILLKSYILIPLIVILSLLLVAEIPMISLKFKSLKYKDNKSRYFLIVSSLILLIFLKIAAIPFIFVLYFAVSLMDNPQKKAIS